MNNLVTGREENDKITGNKDDDKGEDGEGSDTSIMVIFRSDTTF